MEDKLSWIKGSPERYSLAEDKELAAEITRLKGEMNALWNSSHKVQSQSDFTEAQQRQRDLIDTVRKLMQEEKDSGAWPTDKKGAEGFLRFVWRKHQSEITRHYGSVEFDTIRRKTSPSWGRSSRGHYRR